MLAAVPAAGRPRAVIGIHFPALSSIRYYTLAALEDARDNLHASYVRAEWYPEWRHFERRKWFHEDSVIHRICANGLKLMVLTPLPKSDSLGQVDLVGNIEEFFARYTKREPGCLKYAEIANEADLPQNGFKDVGDYAQYYEAVAPIAAHYGVEPITSGTSGKDLPWTYRLATILAKADPPVPLAGFGFHPYGVAPGRVGEAVDDVRRAAAPFSRHGRLPDVFVTEMGEQTGPDLYDAILSAAPATPALTVFEYVSQHRLEDPYGVTNHDYLYQAMQNAWQALFAKHEE